MKNEIKMTIKMLLIVMIPIFAKMGRGNDRMLWGVKKFENCNMTPLN